MFSKSPLSYKHFPAALAAMVATAPLASMLIPDALGAAKGYLLALAADGGDAALEVAAQFPVTAYARHGGELCQVIDHDPLSDGRTLVGLVNVRGTTLFVEAQDLARVSPKDMSMRELDDLLYAVQRVMEKRALEAVKALLKKAA